ncbi:MAG: hypothetical protein IJS81_12000 [Selenomonadaceae bacterium]|nr:hypothetical protein [Selenomonadaceae bacterium]
MNLAKVLKFVGGSIIEKPLEIIDKQFNFYQERKNAEHAMKLRHEDAKFQQQLELDRQKFNVELEEMIRNKDVERGAKLLDTIQEYQLTMAKCAVSIDESLEKMTIELRNQAHNLIVEKKKIYRQMQQDAMNSAMEQLKMIRSEFPEGSMEYQIMGEAVRAQIAGIIENSNSFMKMIDADFAKMTDNLDLISRNAADNANQYISMAFGNLMNNRLRGDDTKFLK